LSLNSVSKKQLILEVKDKAKIPCNLKRHLSPRTVGHILRSLPIEGHAHIMGKNIVYLETTIDSGTERPKREFKKGDIAFASSSGSICFFLDDSVPGKAMTPIGNLLENFDVLKDLKPGDSFSLYEEIG